MKTIHITSQDELPQVAGAIIGSLGRRTVVAFRGEMGAGKTTLIREIAAELGAADTVTSPTFAIGNEFGGRDHSTVVYALQQMEKNLQKDSKIKATAEDIIKNIRDR